MSLRLPCHRSRSNDQQGDEPLSRRHSLSHSVLERRVGSNGIEAASTYRFFAWAAEMLTADVLRLRQAFGETGRCRWAPIDLPASAR